MTWRVHFPLLTASGWTVDHRDFPSKTAAYEYAERKQRRGATWTQIEVLD